MKDVRVFFFSTDQLLRGYVLKCPEPESRRPPFSPRRTWEKTMDELEFSTDSTQLSKDDLEQLATFAKRRKYTSPPKSEYNLLFPSFFLI